MSLTRAVPLLLLTAASCHLVFPYSPADHTDARLTDASHDVYGPLRDKTTIDAYRRPVLWSKGFGGVNSDVHATALVADSAGNIYLGGYFVGAVNFGGKPLTAQQNMLFVASFDATYQHRWSTSVAPGQFAALAFDTNDQLVLAGDLEQTATISGTRRQLKGTTDLLLVAYSKYGQVVWSGNYGGETTKSVANAVGVAVMGGTIYATGSCSGSLVVGSMSSCVNTDAFLASFNAKNGAPGSLQVLGGDGVDNGTGVAADANGVYLVGVFSKPFTLGTTTIPLTSTDVILVAFKPGAKPEYRWHKQLGGPKSEQPGGVTVDLAGNVYACGGFQGTGSFPAPLTSTNLYDAFVAAFTSDGKERWARRFGGTGSDLARAMTTDAKGNLYVTGYLEQTSDFGAATRTVKGASDAFVASFSSTGDYRWIQLYGGASNDTGTSLVVSGSTLYATGTYQGDLDLGDGSLLKLTGTTDTFVLQIASP